MTHIPSFPPKKQIVCLITALRETYQTNHVVALWQTKLCICVVEVKPVEKMVYLLLRETPKWYKK